MNAPRLLPARRLFGAALAPIVITATSLVLAAAPAFAGTYIVPDDFPTLQGAVDEAAGSLDVDNVIIIGQSPWFVSDEVLIGADFSETRRLVIRPRDTIIHGTVASTSITEVIFHLETTQYVTIQDLDIVRATTNRGDIMRMASCSYCTLERCRLGSVWSAPGEPNHRILQITYPREVIVRNCVFFSYLPGEFNLSVILQHMDDDLRSVFFYNNVASDYRDYGFEIDDGIGNAAAIIVLRNNVAVNHPDLVVEPHGYHSLVLGATEISTSHNVSYGSDDAHAEVVGGGARSITEQTIVASAFLRIDNGADLDDSFIEHAWILTPLWDRNENFYILEAAGPLHNDASKWGVQVGNGSPHARDHIVLDDIQKEYRPGGEPLHFDRGVDQNEPGVLLAVPLPPLLPAGSALAAAPLRNPARSFAVRFASAEPGRLALEVFDLRGRRLGRAEREVAAQESGVLQWGDASASGLHLYRLTLTREGRPLASASGKVVVLQ